MGDTCRYARASEGKVIEIASIDPADRYKLGPYRCLSCDHIMVPALGRTRKHHFKHKAGRPTNCTDETYLHRLGKITLFKAISDAIQNSSQFPFYRHRQMICDHHQHQFGITCSDRMQRYQEDLIAQFDRIEMEKGVAGFTADLLLTSTRSENCLLLEISVTHQCEQEKIDSGLSIIEIQIQSEDDIEGLKFGIDGTSSAVKCINVPFSEPTTQRCSDPCDVPCTLLLLYNSGKVWYSQTSSSKLTALISDPHLKAWEIIDWRNTLKLQDDKSILDPLKEFTIQQLFGHRQFVKTCMLCKHNGGQVNRHDAYCKARNQNVWMSSSASNCKSYFPATNADEAKQLLDQNITTLS